MYNQTVRQTPNVRIIKATKSMYNGEDKEFKNLRVCAYGRVSTDHEEQASSFEAQKSYFTHKIKSNPNWEFVDFFADEGISGTTAKKRPGFTKMIEYCVAGKVDLVLTKSVSRFSRNLLDSIYYARLLKAKGVEIHFEQENIKTFSMDSELQLSIMSIMAQDDIMRMSRNIKFGQVERARNGKVTYQYNKWYGYEKGEDGKPKIIPSEAVIIKQIFANYIAGATIRDIANELEQKGIQPRLSKKWYPGTVLSILQNEKYCGNSLYQKTLRIDPLSKQTIANTGQLPQYLIENAHEGIITEETFDLARDEIKRRNDIQKILKGKNKVGKYSGKYALTERLYCGECGSSMTRKSWKNRDGSTRYIWMCLGRINGKNGKCKAEVVDEYLIHDALINALNKYKNEKSAIDEMIKRNIEQAMSTNATSTHVAILKNELSLLEKSFSDLIVLSIKSREPELFEERFKALSDKIKHKRLEYERLEKIAETNDLMSETLRNTRAYLEQTPTEITEYDDTLVRQTITKVEVVEKNNLKIIFIDGTESTERMDERK